MNSHDIPFYIEKKQGELEVEARPYVGFGGTCTQKCAHVTANQLLQVHDNLEIVVLQNTILIASDDYWRVLGYALVTQYSRFSINR